MALCYQTEVNSADAPQVSAAPTRLTNLGRHTPTSASADAANYVGMGFARDLDAEQQKIMWARCKVVR